MSKGTDFAEFLQRRERASLDYVRGDGEAFMALVAKHQDASFFLPLGGTHGTRKSAHCNHEDVSSFDPCTESSRFEVFHSASDGDIGYWTGLQHAKVRMAGADKLVEMTLRVTELFRREAGGWCIVHHHADALAREKAHP